MLPQKIISAQSVHLVQSIVKLIVATLGACRAPRPPRLSFTSKSRTMGSQWKPLYQILDTAIICNNVSIAIVI